jgi:hypothetical protein
MVRKVRQAARKYPKRRPVSRMLRRMGARMSRAAEMAMLGMPTGRALSMVRSFLWGVRYG